MSNDVLSYLQGNSTGAKRDLIARCYYEVAQGDPKSAPVAFAVLLDACAEQFAKTPNELRALTSDFLSAVNTARQLEKNVIERQEKGFANVIGAFKDETARASLTLRETALEARATVVQADRLHGEMKPVIARTEEIGKDLLLLRDDLRRFDTSVQRSEKTVEDVNDIHKSTLEIVKHLTKEVRANWMIIGLGLGMTLEYAIMELQPPPPTWADLVIFTLGAGLVQGLLRWDWRFVRNLAKKIVPTPKPKPSG
jgi:hypothetical protein